MLLNIFSWKLLDRKFSLIKQTFLSVCPVKKKRRRKLRKNPSPSVLHTTPKTIRLAPMPNIPGIIDHQFHEYGMATGIILDKLLDILVRE